MGMNLETSIVNVKGVGEKTRKLFEKLQIYTIRDLLYYFPNDYEIFQPTVFMKDIRPGDKVAVLGTICTPVQTKQTGRMPITTFSISDNTGLIQVTFFRMTFISKVLKKGQTFVFHGRIKTMGPTMVMEHPAYFPPADYDALTHVMQPRYSLTKGLTNKIVQKSVGQILSEISIPEVLFEEEFRNMHHLISTHEAFCGIHFPKTKEQYAAARRRFVFEEFFTFLYFMHCNKELGETLPNNFKMFETADTVRFLEQLPFDLTKGQKRVWQEIKDDFSSNICMNRLIQGDVGSGKTIVAVLALLMCVANGYQGAMMAPTEVLAMQHFQTISQYTADYHLPFKPILLVGSMTAKEKRLAREKILTGEANLIIGTHAIIQESVEYRNLALAVTDEQHRFGVRQREALANKGIVPHILVMSATPIPRTLAIILYGDLSLSVIDELPSDRLPIKNCVVNTSYRPNAYKFIAKQVAEGRQVYVICPKIEPDEESELENVAEYTQKLKDILPSSIQVASLHGKMLPGEKTRIMEEFVAHNIDVLVSTTVIEVGINVPNATVMMVENAERFGLSQLHQLRGRVGRGSYQSYCIFISQSENKETMERLQILNMSNDGFYISSQDLKLRGPGDLFGVRQSGEFAFHIADIYTDASLLSEVDSVIKELLKTDPGLELACHRKIKAYFAADSRNSVDFRTI